MTTNDQTEDRSAQRLDYQILFCVASALGTAALICSMAVPDLVSPEDHTSPTLAERGVLEQVYTL